MSRMFLLLASVAGFLSVALGAFAAHGLENTISESSLAIFQTGVQYQMFHVCALLAVAILGRFYSNSVLLKWSGILFCAGIILFSGSLYALSLTSISLIGIITPIGGVAFLLAWALLFFTVYHQELSHD